MNKVESEHTFILLLAALNIIFIAVKLEANVISCVIIECNIESGTTSFDAFLLQNVPVVNVAVIFMSKMFCVRLDFY